MPDKLTVAIGDVHGELDKLNSLLEYIQHYLNGTCSQHDLSYVFLGDYIDRGPDSKGVIDVVRRMQQEGNTIALLGNHEDMMLQALRDARYQSDWHQSYGHITMNSFKENSRVWDTPKEYIDWMNSLPLFHKDDKRTYVHAGFYRALPIEQQTRHVLVWIREEFLNDPTMDGGFVVHGHTPKFTGVPDLRSNRVNVDTGAVFGEVLSAVVFNEDQTHSTHYINSDGAFKAFNI